MRVFLGSDTTLSKKWPTDEWKLPQNDEIPERPMLRRLSRGERAEDPFPKGMPTHEHAMMNVGDGWPENQEDPGLAIERAVETVQKNSTIGGRTINFQTRGPLNAGATGELGCPKKYKIKAERKDEGAGRRMTGRQGATSPSIRLGESVRSNGNQWCTHKEGIPTTHLKKTAAAAKKATEV